MLVLKASILCIIAVALCVTANVARAESYGSDAQNAGAAAAQAKEKRLRAAQQQHVVHPQVSTRKRGK